MNVCIISWTKETRMCIKRFSIDLTVCLVAEKNYRFWGEQKEHSEYTVVSIDAAISAYRTHIIDKFIIPCISNVNALSSIYVPLKTYDIPDDDILYVPYSIINGDGIINQFDLCCFIDRNELDRLELHINDQCNLKCSNCSMLAGLVHGEMNADLELTKRSLKKLYSIFPHIAEIDIFGGEPLLNPYLIEYCDYLRELFPESKIFIVTNGIKVCSLKHDLLQCIQKNKIRLSISYYPVFDDLLEQTIMFCQSRNISFIVMPKRINFLNLYDFSGEQTAEEVFNLCDRRLSIIAMRENKLASCYTPFALCYAESTFKIGYKESQIVNILSDELTPRKILNIFMKAMDCCKFCHCDKVKWYQVKCQENNRIHWSK